MLLVFIFLLSARSMASAQFLLSFSVTEPTCFGLSTGSVAVTPIGGLGPYTYIWNTGDTSSSIDSIPAGVYSVTVTGGNGVVSQSVTVNQPTEVVANVSGDTCHFPAVITAVGSGGTGPYTYAWDTGELGTTITINSPGIYCVTVVDATLCGVVECLKVSAPPVNVSLSASNLTCPGVNTGQVQAFATGGLPPYIYQWSNNLFGQTISNLPAGTYSVTVTDARGCTATATAVVNSPPPFTATLNSTNPTCPGFNNGSTFVSAAGGTPPYTYAWSNGATGTFINNLGPGTYSVTVLDANNCTVTQAVTLSSQSNLMLGAVGSPPSCPGQNNGTATANPNNGIPPYTYAWNTGGTAQTINSLAPGTYTVTVTDALGCFATATAIVPVAPFFTISLSSTNVTTCGANNGTASVSVTQGVPPFTYQWSNGVSGTSTLVNLGPGTYSVTVTSGNNCQASGSVTITAPPPLFANITATPLVCAGQSNGVATCNIAGGTPPFTYTWSNSAMTASISGLPAGTYSVTVTDSAGCQASASSVIQQAPSPVVDIDALTVICGAGNLGSATASATGGAGPYSFIWSTGATGPVAGGLVSGTYTVTVTDQNQCIGVDSVSILIVDNLIVSVTTQGVPCFGGSNGMLTASAMGGVGPYTYSWSNGAQGPVNQNIPVGIYSVTVTDSNGCTGTQTAIVGQPPLLTVTINASELQVCPDASSATLTALPAGGTPAYSFLWSTGATTPIISNIPAGTYSVTVTDMNGCTAAASVTVTEFQAFQVAVTGAEVVCGESDAGAASVVVTGGTAPFSYLWSTGANSESVAGLGSGAYAVTVTDANGCSASAEISILVVSDFEVSITSRDVLCFGDNSGSALVSVSGGAMPYSINWSNGDTGPEVLNLIAGEYFVTVTEASGCVIISSVVISEPPLLQISASGTDVSCFGSSTGSATASAAGGMPPYQFFWSNNQSGGSIGDLGPGNYSVTVQDVNFCQAVTSIQINQPAQLTINAVPAPAACHGFSNGSITTNTAGGTPPFTYQWSNGSQTPSVTGLPAGTYTVEVTDGNGCTASASATVTQPFTLAILIDALQIPCSGASTGILSAQAFGGTGPFTYQWNNGITGSTNQNIGEGLYSVTATDSRGCSATESFSLTAFETPSCSLEIVNYVVLGNDGALAVSASGGIGPYNYAWNNGSSAPARYNLLPGNYSVTVTDANGCSTTCTAALPPPAAVGDFVWLDANFNGIQDLGEQGIPGVTVLISGTQENEPYADTTQTNAGGMYYFLVPPGEYKITFVLPAGTDLRPTVPNAGNNTSKDSDMDPISFMTPFFTVPPGAVDLTWDAGFTPPCVNVDNPGTIGPDYQFLCGSGNVPAPITNTSLPSGGTDIAPVEYIWMRSVVNGPFDSGFWELIPGTNSPNYSPGPVYQTTYFARCARRDDCGPFIESNVVLVEVGNVAVADIDGPEIICWGQSATFTAAGAGPAALIQWSFGPGVSPQTATGSPVTVNFSSFGTFQVGLSVTENGCTASNFRQITVTNSPIYCGNGLVINADPTALREVLVEWDMPEQEPEHLYVIERSADSITFVALAELNGHDRIEGGRKQYRFTDDKPKQGRNYYRIRYVTVFGDEGYSNVEEVILYADSKLVLLYPNPVSGEAVLELFETFNGDVTLDIVSANGTWLHRIVMPKEVKQQTIDFSNYPAGLYFLRLRYGELELKRLKVVKM